MNIEHRQPRLATKAASKGFTWVWMTLVGCGCRVLRRKQAHMQTEGVYKYKYTHDIRRYDIIYIYICDIIYMILCIYYMILFDMIFSDTILIFI